MIVLTDLQIRTVCPGHGRWYNLRLQLWAFVLLIPLYFLLDILIHIA